MNEEEDEYLIPLVDQRVFGAGISKQRVKFVPAKPSSSSSHPTTIHKTPAGDRYLSIVLKEDEKRSSTPPPLLSRPETSSEEKKTTPTDATPLQPPPPPPRPPNCPICNLPLPLPTTTITITPESAPSPTTTTTTTTQPHESSLAHQLCLSHSHPPSDLDRHRAGLRYLTSYGWDPDSRLGLGATGTGIRAPIKSIAKNNTVGIGMKTGVRGKKMEKKAGKKLDAGTIRKEEERGRRKGERLRELFYRDEDVVRYLGGGG